MQNAIAGLRWVLGLVVLGESAHFALSASSARQVSHFGLPQWFPVLLGGIEMLAAILFLMPVARRTGGYALLLIFAVAAAIHVLHGEFDVGYLLIYGTAVVVCTSRQNNGSVGARHDR